MVRGTHRTTHCQAPARRARARAGRAQQGSARRRPARRPRSSTLAVGRQLHGRRAWPTSVADRARRRGRSARTARRGADRPDDARRWSTAAALALIVGPVAADGGRRRRSPRCRLQGGWIVSWEPLQFNLGKLSPVNGLKRLRAVARPGIDLGPRSLIVVDRRSCWVGTRIVWQLLDQTPALGRAGPDRGGADRRGRCCSCCCARRCSSS